MLKDEDMKPRIGTPVQDSRRRKSPQTAVLEAWSGLGSGGAVVWAALGGMSLEKNGTDTLSDRCDRV